MAKKQKSKTTKWGRTRRIDGELYTLYETGSKINIEKRAKFYRGALNLRVLPGKSNMDYALYMKQKKPTQFQKIRSNLPELQDDIGSTLKERKEGRYKAAMSSSALKSKFTYVGNDEDLDPEFIKEAAKEKKEIAKAVRELQSKDLVDKIEPKTDIEPTYKLTDKGKKVFEYDPDIFNEE